MQKHSCNANLPEGFAYSSATKGVATQAQRLHYAITHMPPQLTLLYSVLCNSSARGVAADRTAPRAPHFVSTCRSHVRPTFLSSLVCSGSTEGHKSSML